MATTIVLDSLLAIPSCVAVLVALLGYDRGDTGSHEHVYLDNELGIDQVAVLEDRRNRVWFRCHVKDGTPLEWALIAGFSLCSGSGERAVFIGIYGPEACCYSTSPFHLFRE